MSKFVNYNKREFTLPPGCKDLIDVLRPRRALTLGKDAAAVTGRPAVTRSGQTIGRLSEVPRHISMLVTSRSELFTLMIGTTEEALSIVRYRSESEGISALVLVTNDAERERGIRGFFERHGIEPLENFLVPPDAGSQPVRCLVYPLPAAAPDASQITTDLLRSVYGFTDESEIQFRHHEITDAA